MAVLTVDRDALACDHVNGTLRGSCSLHNQPIILLQGADPMLEICGSVPFGLLGLKARNSTKKRCSGFGNQFFLAVKLITRALPESACKTALMARAVDQLMKQGLCSSVRYRQSESVPGCERNRCWAGSRRGFRF